MWGFCVCLSSGMHALFGVFSSFAIILKRKRELGCFAWMACYCKCSTVPRVGLQCVIVVLPDHTHLLLDHFYLWGYFELSVN